MAIAKNEGPYVREWAIYHKMVCGFDDIIVYENDSTDHTRFELKRLEGEGVCKWKEWPRIEQNPPQPKAYWDSLKMKNGYDWMCLLDVDEFIVLRSNDTIGDFVARFDESAGSVSFNWAIFYSPDKVRTDEPVIKRVNYCYGDSNVKTIARTKAISTAGIHGFWLLPGYKYMHCSGAEYMVKGKDDQYLEARICTDRKYMICDASAGQVNHYMMKSEEEVITRDERGDATRRHHAKKRTLVPYRRLLRSGERRENHTIKRYIEERYGLERFYQEVGGARP